MKIISKLLMLTLLLSVFAGCKKDEDPLPLKDVAGTYLGTITVKIIGEDPESIPNIPITITYISGNDVTLNILGALFGLANNITAPCTVTSTKDSYSLSGSIDVTDIPIPDPSEEEIELSEELSLKVTIQNSNIDKSGHAIINMAAVIPMQGAEIPVMTINFDGNKQ
jgi:hypothetical protein